MAASFLGSSCPCPWPWPWSSSSWAWLWFWQHGQDANNDERTPLFPPPTTILTPPRPRTRPLSQLSMTPTAQYSPGPGQGIDGGRESRTHSPGLSNTERERIDMISRAFASRMHNIAKHPSQPATPQTSTFLPSLAPLTTSGCMLHAEHTEHDHHGDECGCRRASTNPLPSPHRARAPHLGRSTSEPRSLSDLTGAYGHTDYEIAAEPGPGLSHRSVSRDRDRRLRVSMMQLTPAHDASDSDSGSGLHWPLQTGVRPRSATVSQLVSSQSVETDFTRRGRSPGLPGRSVSVSGLDHEWESGVRRGGRARSRRGDEQAVAHKNLGLRGLFDFSGSTTRRARGRSRTRGRRVTAG